MVASPRKLKNPTTSVTVVRMIEEDCAGSWFSDLRIMGMTAPEKPAMHIDVTIEIPITIVRPAEPLHQ